MRVGCLQLESVRASTSCQCGALLANHCRNAQEPLPFLLRLYTSVPGHWFPLSLAAAKNSRVLLVSNHVNGSVSRY